ncbi:MAG: hypothetical protein OIF48_20410 [Silicimonas sp.]|nr:hypothetical protein [Silicimonas sp.]
MASPDDHGHLFAWINALDMMATKALLLADAALARAGRVFALGRVLSLDYSVLASPGFDQLLLLTWKAERRIDALFGPENRPYVTVTGVVSLPRQAPFSLDFEFEVTRDAAT